MSIIIRLQNLPWAANSVDIRRYFSGLSIPEGGVHIVGGEKGDAFIAFSTDEDARQAMLKDGGKVKDMQIKLFLSSRTEMMRVIEQARQLNLAVQPSIADSDRRRSNEVSRSGDSRSEDNRSSENRSRDRSPTSPRRRDKSPARDRRRSPDRRKRDRSRSRSPRRSRDVDRRSDRFKRDERRFEDSSRYRDERERRPRDSNLSQDKKYPSHAEADNMDRSMSRSSLNVYGREQMEHNRRYPASGNPYYDPTNSQPESFSTNSNEPPISTYSIPDYLPNHGKISSARLEKKESMAPHNIHPSVENVEYDQRSSTLSLPYGSKAAYSAEGFEQKSLSRGHSDMLTSSGSSKGTPGLLSSSYEKLPRRSRFEPETQNNPFFDSEKDEAKKMPPPFSRLAPAENLPYPRREEWSREPISKTPENGMWGKNRPTLLDPPSLGKSNRDFVQVVPMDIEEGPSPTNEIIPDVDTRTLYNSRKDVSRTDERRAPHDIESRSLTNAMSVRERSAPSSLTVEVRNLPPDSREADLFDFFEGIALPPANVRLPMTSHGQASSKGFVRLLNVNDFDEAMARSKQYLRDSRIEVVACSANAFDMAPKIIGNNAAPPSNRSSKAFSQDDDYCVQLRGLPYSCKEDDIVRFFNGLAILDVYLETTSDGRASGVGFVEFRNKDDVRASLQMDGKTIGHRYITVSLSSKKIMLMARGCEEKFPHPREISPSMLPQRPQNRSSTPCVTLRGLHESVINKDIAGFFQSVGIIPRAIHIMLRPDKKAAGDAFAELSSQRELEVSLTKNGDILIGNRISVTPITYLEMMDILGRTPAPSVPLHQPLLRTPADELPPRRPIEAEGDMLETPPMRGSRPLLDPFRHSPMRPPFARMRGPLGIRTPRPPFRAEGNRFRNAGPQSSPPDFGSPGCVITINNLHFRAGLEELLEFFGDYPLCKDSIIRKYNENGQTTGEARVAFQNPREAQKAVRELNQKPLMGRPLLLSVL